MSEAKPVADTDARKHVDKDVDQEVADGEKQDDASSASLNNAFIMIYRITSVFAAGLFIIITIIAIMDIIAYIIGELRQKLRVSLDPNFLNAKTTDIQSLEYVKNDADDEPFSIFLEQKLVMGIFIIVATSITLLGLQLGIFFGMKLYFIVKKREFNETLDIPFTYIGLLLLCYLGAVILSSIYKSDFIKNTQSKMKNVRGQLRETKRFIYDSMIADNQFLSALKADDMDTMLTIMQRNANNAMTLQKMLFTYNIYLYYTSQITESDPNWDVMNSMFTPLTIQRQSVDPTLLFQYKRPVFVPNLYPTLRDRLKSSFVGRNGKYDASIERAFLRNFGINMRTLNKKLVRIQNISDGKTSMFGYLMKVFFVSILMSCVILLVVIFIFLSSMFSKIAGFFQGMFGKKEE
jgi:hypothetical protein